MQTVRILSDRCMLHHEDSSMLSNALGTPGSFLLRKYGCGAVVTSLAARFWIILGLRRNASVRSWRGMLHPNESWISAFRRRDCAVPRIDSERRLSPSATRANNAIKYGVHSGVGDVEARMLVVIPIATARVLRTMAVPHKHLECRSDAFHNACRADGELESKLGGMGASLKFWVRERRCVAYSAVVPRPLSHPSSGIAQSAPVDLGCLVRDHWASLPAIRVFRKQHAPVVEAPRPRPVYSRSSARRGTTKPEGLSRPIWLRPEVELTQGSGSLARRRSSA